jgi:hypothetical protein
MIKNSTLPIRLQKLFEQLETHRPAYGQERVYWRVVGMVLGEVFNFGRHRVTQGLMALGITDGDWSGWYRLFSQGRYEERRVAQVYFRETLEHTSIEERYVVGVDGVQIPRSSLRMAGTSWLKAPRTPVFKAGIHRAQRFVHGSWLTPMEAGYSRAIPLRFLPVFPPKAKPANIRAQREWEAGASFLKWVREELDEAGREQQILLTLAEGSYETLNFWRELPERTVLAVRTARNRRLYYKPERQSRTWASCQLWSLSAPSLRLAAQRNNLAETGNPCARQIDLDEVSGAGTVCARRSARHPDVPDCSQRHASQSGQEKTSLETSQALLLFGLCHADQ